MVKSFQEIRQSLLDMGAPFEETKNTEACESWAARNIKSTGELIDFLEALNQHERARDRSFYIASFIIAFSLVFFYTVEVINNLPVV